MRKIVTISTILVASVLVAAFAVPSIFIQTAKASVAAPAPYLAGVSGTGTTQNSNLAKFTLTAGSTIPTHLSASDLAFPVYGYALADTSTGNALVAAIHPSFSDTVQSPNGWHAHVVTLSGTGMTTPGDDFCITSITASSPPAKGNPGITAGISISGNTMTVNFKTSNLPEAAESLTTVTGFVVQLDGGCPLGLGVATTT